MWNPGYSHGWELLYKSTGALASLPGPIKMRLTRAYTELAVLGEVGEDELVPKAWEIFSGIRKVLQVKLINDLEEKEASKIAEDIYEMFIVQSKHLWGTQ